MVFLKRTNFLPCNQDSENPEPGISQEQVFPPDRLELDDCLKGIPRSRQALYAAPSKYFMIDEASDSQQQGVVAPLPAEPPRLGGRRIGARTVPVKTVTFIDRIVPGKTL